MTKAPRFVLALLLLLGAGPSWAGDSMRCGSRLIAVEARAAEILAACGEPSFRDVFTYPGVAAPGEIAGSEQWIYNFGPNQLLRILKIRDGQLIDIETDGYGFSPGGDGRCDPSDIVEGLSKYRLMRACGEPLTRRVLGYVSSYGERSYYNRGARRRNFFPTEVYREEWVYNLGSRNFLKVVTLEDGVVADVENGDRGFDRR
ncbi:MAG TPA: DUF2845 domain-containing protein [Nevskiaceae bacterium]|nr:DUF2845 domain-containing protein [Nevskiaceae bacterium]